MACVSYKKHIFSQFSLCVNWFSSLEAIACKYISQHKDILAALETSKYYLKIVYFLSCSINNETISHCIAHALSESVNKYLSKGYHNKSCHEAKCKQCKLLFETISSIPSITSTLDSIEKADVQHNATLGKITFSNVYTILFAMPNEAKQSKIV